MYDYYHVVFQLHIWKSYKAAARSNMCEKTFKIIKPSSVEIKSAHSSTGMSQMLDKGSCAQTL